jgi:hypothetical protein
MSKFRIPLMIVFILLLALEGYSAKVPLSRWMSLRSDAKEQVREIIRSEVDSREGFSTPQEEKANLNTVENEKEAEDAGYKKAIAAANREFSRAKKRRDDVTTQFQAVSTELEDQQKNQHRYREPGQPDCPLQSGHQDSAGRPQKMAPDGKTGGGPRGRDLHPGV